MSLTVAAALTAASSFCWAIWFFSSFSNCATLRPELVLDKVLVLLLPDELAAGKEHLAELSLVEVVDQFAVADAQSHAVGFVSDGSLGDHAVGGTLHQKRHQRGRNVAPELLLARSCGRAG